MQYFSEQLLKDIESFEMEDFELNLDTQEFEYLDQLEEEDEIETLLSTYNANLSY